VGGGPSGPGKDGGPGPTCGIGNPCNPATGNKYQAESDYGSGDGSLSFTRHYNSQFDADIGLGFGWTSTFHKRLEINGSTLRIRQATGRDEPFTCPGSGPCSGDPDTKLLLSRNSSGYALNLGDGATEGYDLDGHLLFERDRAGKTTTYNYDADGRLSMIVGPFGHALAFAYDANGHLSTMTNPAGGVFTYEYDANDNLIRVTYPDGASRSYHYEDSAYSHHLTGITDENGDRFATYAYDANGKAILTEHAGGRERFALTYDSDSQTTVTDAAGIDEVLTFEENLQVKNLLSRINQIDGKGLAQEYDDQNNLIRSTGAEGRVTTYTYNVDNQRLTMTEAFGTPDERTTTFTYVSDDIDLPTEVITPSVMPGQQKRVTTVYDANNNPIQITRSGFTLAGEAVSRTITMQYNASGQVTQIDGPRTDVADITTLEYYDCTTGAECGQLRRITNAAGQATTYDTYDAHGRVTQATDPNGVIMAFTYDPRGRVTSITLNPPAGPSRTTTNTYDGVGQLLTVTTADGIRLEYTYDAAHDLRSIEDNLQNRVEYAFDARGNRITEKTRDPDGVLVRTIEQSYDSRNRLEQVNTAGSTTQIINDAVGNLVSQTDPNANPPTNHSYDGLDRLIETLDSLSGVTGYDYDVNDRITRVSAPNDATTQYLYDDLGNVLEERSPDRGTLTYSYDKAGNLESLTDARGVTAAFTYDALNRIILIDYPGTEEDIRYTYDTCENGIGRLCVVQDESGTTGFSYDAYGNVIEQVHTELGVDYRTAYTFDAGDRVRTITYPDGRVVTYTRDVIGRIVQVTTSINGETKTLLENVGYRADGLVTGQTFGNGLAESRLYDQQGRLTSQFVGGADTRVYEYDANGNVIRKQTLPEIASYIYDPLDRLDAETVSNGSVETVDYIYDPNGNRLDANDDSYTYAPASNRLTAINTNAVALDAAGNTLSDGQGRSFSYNAAGRLAQLTKSGTAAATYTYNSQGQRTRKVTSAGTTVYHYDLAGNLIAESDSSGKTVNRYIWANGAPVATYLDRAVPGVFTFSGTDRASGNSVGVRVDTNTQRLTIDETGGVTGEIQPDRWVLDEASQTLNVLHRMPEGTRLAATFELAATSPSGSLSLATRPRRASYRFPNQTGEALTGSDSATGESAILSLDPASRTVTLTEHGTARTLAIAPEDWSSIGFGPVRLTIFRYDEPAFGVFGLVLERRGRAQGFLALRDGVARRANYDLAGQAARTTDLVYVHTDHLGTPRLTTNDAQTVLWRWEGLAFGNTAPKEDPDSDGVKTSFNLRFPSTTISNRGSTTTGIGTMIRRQGGTLRVIRLDCMLD
jgi:YD repeat-containing protein